MPRSSCEPCCNPTELSRSVDSYRSAVLLILCGIFGATDLSNLGPLLTASGVASSAGENVVILSTDVSKSICVYGHYLGTKSSTEVLCKMLNGSGGVERYRNDFQAPTNITVGSNLAVDPPAFLYKTDPGMDLILELSIATDVHYSLSYFEATVV